MYLLSLTHTYKSIQIYIHAILQNADYYSFMGSYSQIMIYGNESWKKKKV